MHSMPSAVRLSLEEHYPVSEEQVRYFQIHGFIKLKKVLPPETITYMDSAITQEVKRLNTQDLPMEKRDTYGKAFLQIMNIWTKSALVKDIVFSKRLAKIAADLLMVSGVRIYHDQALYKEPKGGHTPWHADQYYWPLSTEKTVTAWIPLQPTGLELGPLEYSAGSHRMKTGRDLKISDESQHLLEENLTRGAYEHIVEPFELGEVSFHAGWLFHRAGPNLTTQMRKVMTIIYMDKEIRLKLPENENQVNDWNSWCPGVEVGSIVESPINPVLYDRDLAQTKNGYSVHG
jgi:ectoine hydroxylase-related dioxygenase (phytanoyl-CoA dioxygenase family)